MSKDLTKTENNEKHDAGSVGLSDLLCCPFCGYDGIITKIHDTYIAECSGCRCMLDTNYHNREDAAKAWNQRE